jgi:acyl-CoA reductase-like NAD-dependent aldehyde dehydrogenase
MTVTEHFIAGEWRAGDGATVTDVNPSTGKPIAEVAVATAEEVDAAVSAARAALDAGWSETPGNQRRKLLLKLAELIAADAAELARIATDDMGMPLAFSFGEAFYAAEYLEYFAGWADKIHGDVVPVVAPGVLDYTLREPVGVVAGIVPWNAPLTLTIYKLAPAIAAGNAVVFKPSELAPLAPARLMELVAQAGFPPGTVNMVTGTGAETGQLLVEHPGVDKIAFTGGTRSGRAVAEAAGRHLKRVSLELGGKSANVVFADADLDAAAKHAAIACFLMSGQQCTAGSRLLVERSVEEEFVGRVVEATKDLIVGDPSKMETQLGPLISDMQLQRVLGLVAEGRSGAEIALGGTRLGDDLADGYFLAPTVLTNVSNDSAVAREEIFGPVLSIIEFDDEAEAVHIANDTAFGLAGAVWTNDLNRAHRMARAIKSGTVWVNTWLGISPGIPFGGVKGSGIGREGGRQALDLYTETKNVYVQLR